MSEFGWGMIAGATILLVGFTIGWNGAFFVMWRHNKTKADNLEKYWQQQESPPLKSGTAKPGSLRYKGNDR